MNRVSIKSVDESVQPATAGSRFNPRSEYKKEEPAAVVDSSLGMNTISGLGSYGASVVGDVHQLASSTGMLKRNQTNFFSSKTGSLSNAQSIPNPVSIIQRKKA